MNKLIPLIAVTAVITVGLANGQIQDAALAHCSECGVCQSLYRPVCGADGVTYYNACHLGCEKSCRTPGLKIAHDGECGNPVVYKYH